jgi:tellurite methyltransferase
MDADYEPLYRRGERLFGPPSRPVAAFFATLTAPTSVLDLGCGQGRHALFAARLGHQVTGVDHAETGITQMLADAGDLPVSGVVADVSEFRSRRKFGVVLLVRVLHLVPDRRGLLARAASFVRKGGYVVVEDSARLRGESGRYFVRANGWRVSVRRANFVCAQKG